mmetsp:Transcript_59846/g.142263  ORF Transcript_59846/g.142263 Transcript_59846/m.142263 type:complete len:237 (+) Transcript_59846:2394-3104(+)
MWATKAILSTVLPAWHALRASTTLSSEGLQALQRHARPAMQTRTRRRPVWSRRRARATRDTSVKRADLAPDAPSTPTTPSPTRIRRRPASHAPRSRLRPERATRLPTACATPGTSDRPCCPSCATRVRLRRSTPPAATHQARHAWHVQNTRPTTGPRTRCLIACVMSGSMDRQRSPIRALHVLKEPSTRSAMGWTWQTAKRVPMILTRLRGTPFARGAPATWVSTVRRACLAPSVR